MTPYEQWDIVSSVGRTALGVAAARALETRDGGLVDDPYAEQLVRAAQPDGEFAAAIDDTADDQDAQQLWPALCAHTGTRSRFFDDFLERAAAAGVRQAVLLASGLDTRPYRLDWPTGSRVFEIDQPQVIDFKQHALSGTEPRCEHHAIRADLREDWPAALLDAGFDPEAPTAWLAEALLSYLPSEAERELLDNITRLSTTGSRFALQRADYSTATKDDPFFESLSRRFGVDLGQLAYPGDRSQTLDELTDRGWHVQQDQDGAELGEQYGRRASGPGEEFVNRVHFAIAHLDG